MILKESQVKYRSKLAKSIFVAIPIFVLASLSLIAFSVINKQSNVSAVSATDFNAGNIISDSVFYNKDAMNAQQIQDFLNKLLPSCYPYGQASVSGFNPPYVCLKDYYENPSTGENSFTKGSPGSFSGGISAAQIIYNAAQEYRINPQVLLVLLKKESLGPLTSDTWPVANQYKFAMGYACPDSGPDNTANCDSSKSGFYEQIRAAAWQLNYYKNHPNDYRYSIGWNDIQYSPNASCGTKRVYIENIATLSLYIYTPYTPNDAALSNYPGTADCGAYGNRNFFMFFSEWFGSTQSSAPTYCDSKVNGVSCVWRLKNRLTKNDFLTTSIEELNAAINSGDWYYIDRPFYAFNSQSTESIPVYRLRSKDTGFHFYTTSESEKNSLLSTYNYEGVAFYAYPNSMSSNISYPIYRSYSLTSGHTYNKEANLSIDYSNEGIKFNTPSGKGEVPIPSDGKINVYRLNADSHMYTTNLLERDTMIDIGWRYEQVLINASSEATDTPIYRLYKNKHIFTSNKNERNILIAQGWTDEGVGWYLNKETTEVYRLFSSKSGHLLTTSIIEAISALKSGYTYENIAFGKNSNNSTPIYRLYDSTKNRHFYTTNVEETLTLTSKNWRYEGVAWYGSNLNSIPVYRLYDTNNSRHFYTANVSEKESLEKLKNWRYEGVAWYK